jgi:hypothetical protein
MLMLSLPKGIAAFVTVAAGLSVSLPLSLFVVGLPLLAETIVLCRRMLDAEHRYTRTWRHGEAEIDASTDEKSEHWAGWRALLSVLKQPHAYRGIGYAFLQLPIGIAAFTLAIVLPALAWAVMLSPLAYQVSTRMYGYDLFADDYLMNHLLADWSPFLRSWVYGGIGLVLVLLMPVVLRALARLYTAWISGIAGAEPQHSHQPATAVTELQPEALSEPQWNI